VSAQLVRVPADESAFMLRSRLRDGFEKVPDVIPEAA
jgi:hypothetical protein